MRFGTDELPFLAGDMFLGRSESGAEAGLATERGTICIAGSRSDNMRGTLEARVPLPGLCAGSDPCCRGAGSAWNGGAATVIRHAINIPAPTHIKSMGCDMG